MAPDQGPYVNMKGVGRFLSVSARKQEPYGRGPISGVPLRRPRALKVRKYLCHGVLSNGVLLKWHLFIIYEIHQKFYVPYHVQQKKVRYIFWVNDQLEFFFGFFLLLSWFLFHHYVWHSSGLH